MPFKIVRNDITKMNTEAIVNTANDHAAVGPGCDSAVYRAAGYEELLSYRKEKIGYVPEGEVFLTPGFNLSAKYIIHAVSPLYQGGGEDEEEKLRSCYRKSLQLAKENNISSIAFPLISTGSYGYPREEGMRIAADEINAFLLKNEMEIFLVVFDDRATELGGKIYPDLEEYIDRYYIESKRREEYGDAYIRPLAQSAGHFRPAEDTMPHPSASAPVHREERIRESRKSRKNLFGQLFRKEETVSAPQTFEKPQLSDAWMEEKELCAGFDEKLESKLEERMRHVSDTFSQYLMYLIQDKKMSNADVYKRAVVDKKTFSKIKNNVDYHPQKLTALCLCIGAKLNLDESKDLLARAGYALSPCDKTDIIFSYFIENEIYDMIELDIQLEEHGLPIIIV